MTYNLSNKHKDALKSLVEIGRNWREEFSIVWNGDDRIISGYQGHTPEISKGDVIALNSSGLLICNFQNNNRAQITLTGKSYEAVDSDFEQKEGQNDLKSEQVEKDELLAINFVDLNRMSELRAITSAKFNLAKLIKLCDEINNCYTNENYYAVGMLVRAILDHVPSIFNLKTFVEVANNYNGNGSSFKQAMKHLEGSSRNIADSYLHTQARNKETLPNKTQVNFSADLDLLLAEIIRILK